MGRSQLNHSPDISGCLFQPIDLITVKVRNNLSTEPVTGFKPVLDLTSQQSNSMPRNHDFAQRRWQNGSALGKLLSGIYP